MNNILETELITDEQMLSLMGGRDTCVSCTQTEKKTRGDSEWEFSPKVDLGDLLESADDASE